MDSSQENCTVSFLFRHAYIWIKVPLDIGFDIVYYLCKGLCIFSTHVYLGCIHVPVFEETKAKLCIDDLEKEACYSHILWIQIHPSIAGL